MKLIRTFEITSDEFYDYLEAQLLEEISKTTKKNVRVFLKQVRKNLQKILDNGHGADIIDTS